MFSIKRSSLLLLNLTIWSILFLFIVMYSQYSVVPQTNFFVCVKSLRVLKDGVLFVFRVKTMIYFREIKILESFYKLYNLILYLYLFYCFLDLSGVRRMSECSPLLLYFSLFLPVPYAVFLRNFQARMFGINDPWWTFIEIDSFIIMKWTYLSYFMLFAVNSILFDLNNAITLLVF